MCVPSSVGIPGELPCLARTVIIISVLITKLDSFLFDFKRSAYNPSPMAFIRAQDMV